MRTPTIPAAVAVLAVIAFAGAVPSALLSLVGWNASDGPYSVDYSDPDLAGNVTIQSRYRCESAMFPGRNLSDFEALSLEACYSSFNRTQWLVGGVPCGGTDLIWEIWGHHWKTPEHCYAACDDCMHEAIGNRSNIAMCYKGQFPHWDDWGLLAPEISRYA
ncbi:hypothetical protein F5Y05DRAFT_412034 [Hypoxylon sp. FL0543]|nr:hypothetical protein F5Y05DRAFT_412034 [Hypoxylon sp. FL0543]